MTGIRKRDELKQWVLASVVGAVAALAIISFRSLIHFIEFLGTGHKGGLVEAAMSLPPWHRAAVCTVGGLLAGATLQLGGAWAARGPRGDQNLDYVEAARHGRVDLNDRTTLARTASALLSVGTGASIGREGPMVQLAAWVSAWLAKLTTSVPEQRNVLMVCGIAAGIGSAYHAPLAGVVFFLELALGFFARHTVAPLLIASATASALMYWLVEPGPMYDLPAIPMAPIGLGIALLSGLVFGGIAWALIALLDETRERFARIHSLTLRLGLGGLLVGLLSAAVPQVWGNGFSVVSQVLQTTPPSQWLLMVLVAKVVATSCSSGSGAIGGVFTPSLFVGAVAGSLFAQIAAAWIPGLSVGPPQLFAILGMAAVLAAVTHAPLMAIVMVIEMTNQFQLALPVMLASGVAYAVSTRLGVRPLYGNPIEATNAKVA